MHRVISASTIICALILAAAGCQDATGTAPDTYEGLGEPPRQLFIVGTPDIVWAPEPVLYPGHRPDSQFVAVRVTAPDSFFARRWWPTEIVVETDREERRTVLLAPSRCILPDGAGTAFPLTFTWWICDQVGVNTRVLLSPERLRAFAEIAGGDTVLTWPFRTMPGGQYRFGVGVGQRATAEAVRRLSGIVEVVEAFRIRNDPHCVRSDIVPPPPCDPWQLARRLAYVFERQARGDTLSLSRDGWIRVTYRQPDGTQRVTTRTARELGLR